MSILIQWPALALIPAILFAMEFQRGRQPLSLVTALAWLGYAAYEYAMQRRWLCTGECNIRVDLLLIYPVLAALSAGALVAVYRARRTS